MDCNWQNSIQSHYLYILQLHFLIINTRIFIVALLLNKLRYLHHCFCIDLHAAVHSVLAQYVIIKAVATGNSVLYY